MWVRKGAGLSTGSLPFPGSPEGSCSAVFCSTMTAEHSVAPSLRLSLQKHTKPSAHSPGHRGSVRWSHS